MDPTLLARIDAMKVVEPDGSGAPNSIPVVDLFSGPGGLAEGFAGYRDAAGRPRFRIALSVEMEESAYRTLLLRAFLRKFSLTEFPSEYYDFLNGEEREEPDWAKRYPEQWEAACDETRQLTLGTSAASAFLTVRLPQLREQFGDRLVLLGGPPCQSYSLVGRARNAGNADYDASKDERQLLYREYVRAMRELQPAVAVMENVKGVLSAKHNDKPIFRHILTRLKNPGGGKRYGLFALAPPQGNDLWNSQLEPRDYLVRTEDFGIPQARHRVFVVCVREDLAPDVSTDSLDALLRLDNVPSTVTVADMIGKMPALRSRISRGDSETLWRSALNRACDLVERASRPELTDDETQCFNQAVAEARKTASAPAPPYRDASGAMAPSCADRLRDWIHDAKLKKLPNHETRGHMADDLARYLFAAAFARAKKRSPHASHFPDDLAPKHANWSTGKFGDRFRVQLADDPSSTVTSHISKDGHYYIHPDPGQCRSLTVREAARLQTFPDNYFFQGPRTRQYVQVGNAVPPFLARQIAARVWKVIERLCQSPQPAPDGSEGGRHDQRTPTQVAVPEMAEAR